MNKVRFSEDPHQLQEHDSAIVIRTQMHNVLQVHLGFLQINHHYEIQFSVKDDLGEDLEADPLQNLHAKVMEVMPTEDGG